MVELAMILLLAQVLAVSRQSAVFHQACHGGGKRGQILLHGCAERGHVRLKNEATRSRIAMMYVLLYPTNRHVSGS